MIVDSNKNTRWKHKRRCTVKDASGIRQLLNGQERNTGERKNKLWKHNRFRRFSMCASDDRKEKAFTHEAWNKNGRFSQMGV